MTSPTPAHGDGESHVEMYVTGSRLLRILAELEHDGLTLDHDNGPDLEHEELTLANNTVPQPLLL